MLLKTKPQLCGFFISEDSMSHTEKKHSEKIKLRDVERNYIKMLRDLCGGDQEQVNELLKAMIESVREAKLSLH